MARRRSEHDWRLDKAWSEGFVRQHATYTFLAWFSVAPAPRRVPDCDRVDGESPVAGYMQSQKVFVVLDLQG